MAANQRDGKQEKIIKLCQEINPTTGKLWTAREIAKALNISRSRVYDTKSYYLSSGDLMRKEQKFIETAQRNGIDKGDARAAWESWADSTDSVREELENFNRQPSVGIGGDNNNPTDQWYANRCPNCRRLSEENKKLRDLLQFYIKLEK